VALEMVDMWGERARVPAVAAAAVGPDGVREARSAGDARPDSLFALASLTKPLVALAALVAVEEGALGLDEPAGRHLPA
jgi:CubicO group peptidase (beta-lactamase class C family)